MSDRLSSPVALISGSARRIGRNLAQTMAQMGWKVAIHYWNSSKNAESLAQEIISQGGEAVPLQADLENLDEVRTLIPACCSKLGPPSCLINNASQFFHDTFSNLTLSSWKSHLDINLRAPVFLSQAMAHHLPDNVDGNIVNIIDQRVQKLTPDFFSYTVSKAALWTATQMLAQALAPRIRVNAIAPGPVLKNIHQSEKEFSQQIQRTLLKRRSSPSELSAAVQFILNAPGLTGQMIVLDNGQHLVWSEDPSSSLKEKREC